MKLRRPTYYITILWYGNSPLTGKPIQNWNAWMRFTTMPPENNIESTWLLNNTCVVHYIFLRCICNWLKLTAEGEVHIREWLKATCEYHTLTRWAVYWHPLALKAKFVYTTFSKYKCQQNRKYTQMLHIRVYRMKNQLKYKH